MPHSLAAALLLTTMAQAQLQESLQKALRSMETGLSGLDPVDMPSPDGTLGEDPLRGWLGELVPYRVLRIAMAIRNGMSLDEIKRRRGETREARDKVLAEAEKKVKEQKAKDMAKRRAEKAKVQKAAPIAKNQPKQKVQKGGARK